jgi:phosphoglycolate phosphatase
MHPNADNLIASRFDTVIYDLDGTLIDSARDMQVAVSNVLADHGLPTVTEDDVRIFMGQGSKVTMNKAFAKYGKALDDEKLSAVTREFVRYYEADPISNTIAFPGVADVVDRFGRLGLKQGVCTNKFERPSRMMLVARMGSVPERAVMIGDSIHDVEAAHGAGLPAVLVSWGYTATPASELGAEAVIERFDALPQALEKLATR